MSGGGLSPELWRRLAEAQEAALRGSRPLAMVPPAPAPPAARWRRAVVLGVAASAAAAAGLVLVLSRPEPAALRFQVGPAEAEGKAGRPLVAQAGSDLPLRFSDGSAVTFQAGASGRVGALSPTGAEVILEAGALEAHVVHAARTRWQVRAGPFVVRVTGTRFGVRWQDGILAVALHEGSVVVGGGPLTAEVVLRAGQRLVVDAHAGLAQTEALAPAQAVAPAAAPPQPGVETAPVPAAEPAARRARDRNAPRGLPPPAPAVAPPAPPGEVEDWLRLAEAGEHAAALAAARRRGVPELLERLDARGLLVLGDVARYAKAPALAAEIFARLVARFPHDPLAADAVFSLGRLAFEAGRPRDAADWFAQYGARWPAGPLAEQAAGRLVEAARDAGDREAAREAARAYLARSPRGAHAAVARAVLEADR